MMSDTGLPFTDPRRFRSATGGSTGAVEPGAIYEAKVLHVVPSTANLGKRKIGQISIKILSLGVNLRSVSVTNQSPIDPLTVDDRVLVAFLDMKLKRCVCFGRLDGQADVFIPFADTDGKGSTRPVFEGTITGEKIALTGSGTAALNVTNGITASTGQFTSINANSHSHSSDRRMKTRIKPLTNGLERIKRLVGVRYKKRTAVGTTEEFQTMDGYQYGIIAQDSAAVIPSAVLYDPDKDVENAHGWSDAYGVDYGTIVPVLIEAVKELAQKVEELENGQNPSSGVG
jgi:hypothetical protein